MTVLPDRSIIGRAIDETVADSGHLLTIQLPAGSEILWAVVDSNPTIPLRSGPGAWSIVRDGRREERIPRDLEDRAGAPIGSLVGRDAPGGGRDVEVATHRLHPARRDDRRDPRRLRAGLDGPARSGPGRWGRPIDPESIRATRPQFRARSREAGIAPDQSRTCPPERRAGGPME